MLVLSRKYGEKICIGDNIVITVVDIDRSKVRIGIECPRDIAIYREELKESFTKHKEPEESPKEQGDEERKNS